MSLKRRTGSGGAGIDTAVANPFSTRFVAPGQIPYQFAGLDQASAPAGPFGAPAGADRLIQQLGDQLDRFGAAAIIGPHGTGKTTLLRWLARHLSDRDWPVQHAGPADALPDRQLVQRCLAGGGLWLIDGWERYSVLQRWRLTVAARRSAAARRWRAGGPPLLNLRLLVTAHRRQLGIPTLHQTVWDDALIRQLTDRLIDALASPHQRQWMRQAARRRAAVIGTLPRWRRSVRDYWFGLYDDFERLRQRQSELDASPNQVEESPQ